MNRLACQPRVNVCPPALGEVDYECSTRREAIRRSAMTCPQEIPLRSKSVSDVSDQPGLCAPSGGDPGGDPIPLLPSTFCCRE